MTMHGQESGLWLQCAQLCWQMRLSALAAAFLLTKIVGIESSICTGTCALRLCSCSIRRDGDGNGDEGNNIGGRDRELAVCHVGITHMLVKSADL